MYVQLVLLFVYNTRHTRQYLILPEHRKPVHITTTVAHSQMTFKPRFETFKQWSAFFQLSYTTQKCFAFYMRRFNYKNNWF